MRWRKRVLSHVSRVNEAHRGLIYGALYELEGCSRDEHAAFLSPINSRQWGTGARRRSRLV